jgi:hypothetical protein
MAITMDDVRAIPREVLVANEMLVTTPSRGRPICVLCLWDPSDANKRAAAEAVLARYLPDSDFEFLQALKTEGFDPRAWLENALEAVYRPTPRGKLETQRCSFCGLPASSVKNLIAGGCSLPPTTRRPEPLELPPVCICDECIALASEIVRRANG